MADEEAVVEDQVDSKSSRRKKSADDDAPQFPKVYNCVRWPELRIYRRGSGRTGRKTPDGRDIFDDQLREYLQFRNGLYVVMNEEEDALLANRQYVYPATLDEPTTCTCGRRWHNPEALKECMRSHPHLS